MHFHFHDHYASINFKIALLNFDYEQMIPMQQIKSLTRTHLLLLFLVQSNMLKLNVLGNCFLHYLFLYPNTYKVQKNASCYLGWHPTCCTFPPILPVPVFCLPVSCILFPSLSQDGWTSGITLFQDGWLGIKHQVTYSVSGWLTGCKTPGYLLTLSQDGWLGIKHQVTYLLCLRMADWL